MKNTICWIDVVNEDNADSALSQIYQRVRSPDGQLDNLYQGFSLRPHTIVPADDLYLAALHHKDNALPKVFAELIGTYVAMLGQCEYAIKHHGRNFAHLNADAEGSVAILGALETGNLQRCGSDAEVKALRYARKLTVSPEQIVEEDVSGLKQAGWSDGEILEIVQVVAMFSYFVRVINGVGISLGSEKVGLY